MLRVAVAAWFCVLVFMLALPWLGCFSCRVSVSVEADKDCFFLVRSLSSMSSLVEEALPSLRFLWRGLGAAATATRFTTVWLLALSSCFTGCLIALALMSLRLCSRLQRPYFCDAGFAVLS